VVQTAAGNITLTNHLPHLSLVAPGSTHACVEGRR
jgi:hypothetical protein